MRYLIVFLIGLFAALFAVSPAFAQGSGETLNLCPIQSDEQQNFNLLCSLNLSNALPGLLSFILIIAVVISLIYLIWGGIKWITSGGDKGNVETARNHIIAAIIGLIVTFLAWFIINMLLSLFFGQGLTGDGGLTLPTIGGASSTSPPAEGRNPRTGRECTPTNKPDCRGGRSPSCSNGRWRCGR